MEYRRRVTGRERLNRLAIGEIVGQKVTDTFNMQKLQSLHSERTAQEANAWTQSWVSAW